MFGNFNFRRFDRRSKEDGFSYKTQNDVKDTQYEFNSISMDKPGFVLHTTIQNYLGESILMGGNLRSEPTLIRSLYHGNPRHREEVRGYVLVTILISENTTATDPKYRTVQSTKTEIRIPAKLLNQGAVFIEELDCYISTESHLDATREAIARDANFDSWDTLNLPDVMNKQDPSVIYSGYRELVRECVERQDKINIRVGVDIDHGTIPDYIRNLHFSIYDHYFVPFDCYKLEYDPTLDSDDLIIENLYQNKSVGFSTTFSELSRVGSMYPDSAEKDTLFGKFYAVAIFSSRKTYGDYVHKRKAQERFSEETLVLAQRSGDPRLKEEIHRLEQELARITEATNEQDQINKDLMGSVKRLKADLSDRNDTINKLRTNHDSKMSAEAVMADLTNERMRIETSREEIDRDREEIRQKVKSAKLAQRVAILKALGDILKSGWGIATACIGGILSVIAVCKKYNVKISMAT